MSPMSPPIPSDPLLILGETTFRRQHRRFGLLPADRLRHLYLLGKTGSGKSTLIANLVIQDLRAGRGLALLDPHGDLVQNVLPFVPRSRVNDVLLFSPEDREHPVSFNVFRRGRVVYPESSLLTAQLVALFKKLWSDAWGPRLEHILRCAILAVAPDPRATLVFLYRFLTDEQLRRSVAERAPDPVVRQFWLAEFPLYGRGLQAEALAPVLNKLGAFVANPTVRGLIGQERSRVDLADIMNRQGIVLADLSSGAIGEDASRLLGGLLLTAIQLSAMERVRGGPAFHVYCDEFQYFVSDAVATMLSEARKFGVSLVLAHQYIGQLSERVRDAVLGNVGSMVLFRVGGSDAEILAREIEPVFTATDLLELPRGHIVVRMVGRGETLAPFSARTLPPPAGPPAQEGLIAAIREQSRQRYTSERAAVERSISSVFPRSAASV